MGQFFYLVGYFSIMLIFLGIAIKTAKMKWHIIGSVVQFLSLAGLTLSNGATVATEWLIYVFILFVGVVLVKKDNKKENDKD